MQEGLHRQAGYSDFDISTKSIRDDLLLDTNVLSYSTSSVAEISAELVILRGAGIVEVTDDRLSVKFDDGRTISVPLGC
jgi:hypothetical protein